MRGIMSNAPQEEARTQIVKSRPRGLARGCSLCESVSADRTGQAGHIADGEAVKAWVDARQPYLQLAVGPTRRVEAARLVRRLPGRLLPADALLGGDSGDA
jgi:hypothetical protein